MTEPRPFKSLLPTYPYKIGCCDPHCCPGKRRDSGSCSEHDYPGHFSSVIYYEKGTDYEYPRKSYQHLHMSNYIKSGCGCGK
jgi:hypothetical protein